jgi:hypothetical protein
VVSAPGNGSRLLWARCETESVLDQTATGVAKAAALGVPLRIMSEDAVRERDRGDKEAADKDGEG